MIVKRRFDFLSTLKDIASEANKRFPNQKAVGMEIVYRPNSTNRGIRADLFLGWDDCDYLNITFFTNGSIANNDDKRERFSEEMFRDRLIQEIDQLLGERIPGTKEKLEYIKEELKSLNNLKTKVL